MSCPSCGRAQVDVYTRAEQVTAGLEGLEVPLRVAVMGCVVNGPGESKHANVGISLPGTNETPVAPVYVDGEKTVTLKGDRIAEDFQAIVEDYVQRTYGKGAPLCGAVGCWGNGKRETGNAKPASPFA